MNDDAFIAYVISNAPKYEIETLEKIVRGLNDNLAGRRWGKPSGLEVGSRVAATMFDTSLTIYGEVVSMSPQSCTIESPGSQCRSRVTYKRYAIRLLDEFEWNRVSSLLGERRREVDEELAREKSDVAEERGAAIRGRDNAKRLKVTALNGTAELFRGAYVHAYRPDTGSHDYGVIVQINPKSFIISSCESDWESRVWLTKSEVTVLNETQWAIVDREQSRRRAEHESARKAGRAAAVPDYDQIEIPLPN